ncbi:MAG: hypothetical protein IPO62_06655 [Saprospiraceae bacterium]|nr:hypothetical protein [Saprospiraceae bacterium]
MGKIFSYILRMLSFLFISSVLKRKINEMDDKEVKSTLQQMKANSDKLAASIKKYCDDYPDDEITTSPGSWSNLVNIRLEQSKLGLMINGC